MRVGGFMKLSLRRKSLTGSLSALSVTLALVIAPTAASASGVATHTPGPPTLTHGVKPTLTTGSIANCPAGTTKFIKVLNPHAHSTASYSHNGTTFQTKVNGKVTALSFMTNSPGFKVYVGIASAYDTYNYAGTATHPAYPSDQGLHPPYDTDGTIDPITYYLVCGKPAVGKVQPTLTTTPSAGGPAGTVVLNDTGALAGGASPTGSITFNLYDPSDTTCTGTPAYTQTVTVSGNGSYSTTNSTPAPTAGTWNWTAMYTGDTHNFGASSACGKETVSVTKASPSVTTTPTPGGAPGVVLNDTATLASGASPTGSITFNLYDPSDPTCSGTPAYTQTVTVSGNGSYSTTNTSAANKAGTWNWTASYSGDSSNNGASSGCGKEPVSVIPSGSCEGSGSVSALVSGTNVTAYVPKGSWSGSTTGIDVVNVEGTSITNTTIPTGTDVINSCASNSATGQTVCTANNTDIYVLKGTGLDPSVSPNPLTDGGSGTIGFSGGSATTTGVSMDGTNNKALIALSVGGSAGFQFLDLATDTFEPAFTTQDPGGQISEDPLIDPVHHLILSAAEDNNYELVNVSTSTSPQFFEHPVSGLASGDELDSSAEDCSTGIIFAPAEFSSPSQVEIADINPPHAVFTSGTPGSWTAPEQVQTLTGSNLDAGPSGSAVAQGTHTGVVAGEFSGDGLTALALPTTSGTGAVPAIGNWVSCETGPDPSGNPFVMGGDPHTLAAYQSPNGGDAIALMVNASATEMVRVDLTDMLNPSIVPVTGNVCNSATLPSSAETFIPLP